MALEEKKQTVYDKLYGGSEAEAEAALSKKRKINEDDEHYVNLGFAMIISVASLILATTILVVLYLGWAYDLAVFLDSYFLYIAGIIGAGLLYSLYLSFLSFKRQFSIVTLLNIIIAGIALLFVIIPFLAGLLYLNF